jgi:glucose-1-phosphate thymidylyltransferase
MPLRDDIIGVILAGGSATRLGRLPCSKELLPITAGEGGAEAGPRVVSSYLLENLRLAGIPRAVFVLRSGKWDIPAYHGDGSAVGIHLAYAIVRLPWGVLYSLDAAYPFVRGSWVATGFPDIIYEPADAFRQMVAKRDASRAEVVLGVFPTASPKACDMVAVDAQGVIREIVMKPLQTQLTLGWGLALWSPRFTEFLHDLLARREHPERGPELHLGHALQAAMQAGFELHAAVFEGTPFLDVGTPEGLRQALARGVSLGAAPGADQE